MLRMGCEIMYLVVMYVFSRLAMLVIFLLTAGSVAAQSLGEDAGFLPGNLRQYQFQLEKPVERIEQLRYERSGEPIRGTLSPDGTRVLMDHYQKGQRVKFTAVYADGTSEELSKSSCFIDPVSMEL